MFHNNFFCNLDFELLKIINNVVILINKKTGKDYILNVRGKL